MSKLKPIRIARTSSLVVLDPKLLSNIDEALESQGLVIVRAPAMCGKTTIIREWHRQALEKKQLAFSIELRNSTPLSLVTEKIAQSLGFESNEFDLKELFEAASAQNITLIIDGFDRVGDAAFFLSEALEVIRSGTPLRLLLSVEKIQSIDPLDLLDFRIIDYSGLDRELIKKLIVASGVSVGSELTAVADKLFDLTKGNPSLVRLFISSAVEDRRVLSLDALSASYDETVLQFIRTLVARTEKKNLFLLEELALIEYASELRDDVIKNLDASLVTILEQGSLIRRHLDGSWDVSLVFKNTLASQLTNDARFAVEKRIIEKAALSDSALSVAEQVYHLNRLSEFETSLGRVKLHREKLISEVPARVLLDLTEPLWKLMDLSTYRIRMNAYISVESMQTCKQECLWHIQNARSERDRLEFKLIEYRMDLSRGLFPDGVMDLEGELARLSERDPLYWEINYIISRYLRFKDPQRSLKIRLEASEKVPLYPETSYLTRSSYISLAYFYETSVQIAKAISIYELLIEYAEHSKDKKSMVIGRQAKLSLSYDMGRIADIKRDLNSVHALVERSGLIDVFALVIETKALLAYDQGCVYESIDCILKSVKLSENHLLHEYWVGNLFVTLAQVAMASQKKFHFDSILQKYRIASSRSESGASKMSDLVVATLRMAVEGDASEVDSYFKAFETTSKILYPYYTLRTLVSSLEILWQRGILISIDWLENNFLKDCDARNLVSKCRFFQIAETVLRTKDIKSIPKIRVLRNFFSENALTLWVFRCDLLLNVLDSESVDSDAFSKISHIEPKQDAELLEILRTQGQIKESLSVQSTLSKTLISMLSSNNRLSKKAENVASDLQTTSKYWLKLDSREFQGPKGKVSLKDRATAFHLLRVFAERRSEFLDKETLIKLVWNETYNPLVHDTRVYTSVRRLREIVEIETIEGKYRLKLDEPIVIF